MLGGFRPGWRMTAFVVVFLPATISLGIWQQNRAAYKDRLEEAYLSAITQLPVTPQSDELLPELKSRVSELTR